MKEPVHISRQVAAIICGSLAGGLLSNSFGAGLMLRFLGEDTGRLWGTFIWGEHWFLRVVAALTSAAWAGLMVGLIARRSSRILAALAVIPALLCWIAVSYVSWTGSFPFTEDGLDIHVSIGNRLAALAIILFLIPAAISAVGTGAELGEELGNHFDSRRCTLLGIKWYHYLWIPFLMHFYGVEIAYIGVYLGEWYKVTIRAGFSMFGSIIPMIFTVAIYLVLRLMFIGAMRSYRLLAVLEAGASRGAVTIGVLKYGFGGALLTAACQAGIEIVHYGLVKLFN